MPTRGQTIKLGLFVLAAAVLAAASLLVFGGIALHRRIDRYYIAVHDSVAGLEEGARAKIMGVAVGRVSDVRLADDGTVVIVEISVRAGTRIYCDAQAYLRRQGLTGQRYVDVEQRDPRGALFAPGDSIPYRTGALDRLADDAGQIAEQTTSLLDKASHVLDQALQTARSLNVDEANQAIAGIAKAANELARMAADVRLLINENRARVEATLASFEGASTGAAATFRRTDAVLVRIDSLVAELEKTAHASGGELRATLRGLRAAIAEFQQLARDLRRSPSRLLFSPPAKDRTLP